MGMIATPAELTLVDDDQEIIVRPLLPAHDSPVLCREWDLGAPEVREAAVDRAGTDGQHDTTSYTGARTVTLDLVVRDSPAESAYAIVERLAAMTHPTRRPYLHLRRGTGETWRLALRGNPFALTYQRASAARLEMRLAFTAPDGYLESEQREYQTLAPAAVPVGLTFPITFPVIFPDSGVGPPPFDITVYGSVPTAPTFLIHGPAVDPALSLADRAQFILTGLTIGSAQYVEVDMGAGTVRLNGDATSSLHHLVDWDLSTWWRLNPGTNSITFTSDGGLLTVRWRDRRYTA